ncbi:MAG: LacI family DNA-binding transcriptional regulator [Anaerolineaceae bacterium]|nr:LacI family DNA-binding transcriptional regulator [Anaerolineaceae bacterium]
MGNRVTLKQVAARAGVSYQTVSKVLNNQSQVSQETEQRVWHTIHELGYRPNFIARSLRAQSSHMIGYSWEPTSPDVVNPILDQFLQSMVQESADAGYHLLAFPYRPGNAWTDVYRDLMDTNRVDGFIVSSINYDDPRILLLLEQRFPFVAFGRSNPGLDFPFVDVDGAAGMRMVIEHLVSRNHRRIAILTWPESSRVGQNRMDGVIAGLEAAGLALPEGWLARGEGNYQFGYQATLPWLDLPTGERPTAIVAFNDIMAIGAIHAASSRGLQVGQDIAITGFDDAPMVQYLTPSLTTVRQPTREVGQRAMSMLLEMLDGKTPEDCYQLLAPRLIVRASTGG